MTSDDSSYEEDEEPDEVVVRESDKAKEKRNGKKPPKIEVPVRDRGSKGSKDGKPIGKMLSPRGLAQSAVAALDLSPRTKKKGGARYVVPCWYSPPRLIF